MMFGHRPRLQSSQPGPLGALWRRWRGDRTGTSVLEFAVVSMPLIGFILGIINISLIFFAQQLLETTAEQAGRSLMTGTTQQANTTKVNYKAAVCAKLYSMLDCSNLYVDVQSGPSFKVISATKPTLTTDGDGNVTNSFAYAPGNAGSVVILRLLYLWPISAFPGGAAFATNGNKRLLVATSVFKVEPYQ